jgi:hypothetical protein
MRQFLRQFYTARVISARTSGRTLTKTATDPGDAITKNRGDSGTGASGGGAESAVAAPVMVA